MNVHDSSGAIDSAKFLEYIINQFPGDLKLMIEVRDELALRQGAVSAAQLAIADREAAAKELADTKAIIGEMLADAKAKNAEAKAKKAALDDRERVINDREKLISDELTLRDTDIQTREDRVAAKEANVAQATAENAKIRSVLEEQAAALDARIKAFQEKVAALSA